MNGTEGIKAISITAIIVLLTFWSIIYALIRGRTLNAVAYLDIWIYRKKSPVYFWFIVSFHVVILVLFTVNLLMKFFYHHWIFTLGR